jgi:hypothetical protein
LASAATEARGLISGRAGGRRAHLHKVQGTQAQGACYGGRFNCTSTSKCHPEPHKCTSLGTKPELIMVLVLFLQPSQPLSLLMQWLLVSQCIKLLNRLAGAKPTCFAVDWAHNSSPEPKSRPQMTKSNQRLLPSTETRVTANLYFLPDAGGSLGTRPDGCRYRPTILVVVQ